MKILNELFRVMLLSDFLNFLKLDALDEKDTYSLG